MTDVNDDDVYNIDELTEREIEKVEEEKNKGSRTRYIFLSPGRKESMRSTNLRPVFLKNNPFGQQRPMMQVRLHEGLDKLVPGGRKRAFPHIQHGVEAVVCLNSSDTEDYCHVCRVEPEFRKLNYDIRDRANSTDLKKDVTLHQKMRSWFSKFKSTLFHFFIAVRRIPNVTEGKEWDEGKMPVRKDPDARTDSNKHGLRRCTKEEVELWVDPIGVVKIKDWWIESLMTELNRREMTHTEYEAEKGRKVTQAEYLRECPKSRPKGPFHPEEGYCIEMTVSGKGKDQTWKARLGRQGPLTKSDKVAMVAAYPDMMADVTPHGSDLVEPLEKWLAANKGKTKIDWAHYRKLILMEAQEELLGLNKGTAVDEADSLEALVEEGEGEEESTGDEPQAYALDGASEVDDIDIDDIPF
jgi:hypothetical protein